MEQICTVDISIIDAFSVSLQPRALKILQFVRVFLRPSLCFHLLQLCHRWREKGEMFNFFQEDKNVVGLSEREGKRSEKGETEMGGEGRRERQDPIFQNKKIRMWYQ